MATPKKAVAVCATTPACDAKTKVKSGKRLVVSGDDNCDKDLEENCSLPAIPVQLKNGTVELRDGSSRKPIPLENIQKLESECITGLLFVKSDGSLSKWVPPQQCGEYKLKIVDGKICVKEDTMPSTMPADICVSDCDEIDYILGVKMTTLYCKGGKTRQVAQIKAVPKCCCTAEEISSITSGGFGQ